MQKKKTETKKKHEREARGGNKKKDKNQFSPASEPSSTMCELYVFLKIPVLALKPTEACVFFFFFFFFFP